MPEILDDNTYDKVSRALIYAREHVPLPCLTNLFDSLDVNELINGAKKALDQLEAYKRFMDDSSALGDAVKIVAPEPGSVSVTVIERNAPVILGDLFEAPEAFPDMGKRTEVTGTDAPKPWRD